VASGGTYSREVLNREARHRYEILQHFEAGIVLQGTEIKSFRGGDAQIADAFVRIGDGHRPILINAHIDEYHHGTDANHVPKRQRYLLLHRKEIERLRSAQDREGMSIIPLRMYLKKGLAKLDIAICKGKRAYDKRRALKQRVEKREIQRALVARQRGLSGRR
jgi:SsrA-binding protein